MDQLHPQKGPRGCMGVCPTSPHVFCGCGEGIQLCPSGRLVGGFSGVSGPLKAGCSLPVSTGVRVCSAYKSDLFPVRFGLRQGCPLSLIQFITFMDRISWHSHGVEGSGLGTSRSGLCFLQMM